MKPALWHTTVGNQAVHHKIRQPIIGNRPEILSEVFQSSTNIVVWKRKLSDRLQQECARFVVANPGLSLSMVVERANATSSISPIFGGQEADRITTSVVALVDLFCALFELKKTRLQLATVNHAMCPRFHADHLPCRLVTTYHGVCTEWLAHESVDRTKLGPGSGGLPDHKTGLYTHSSDIHRLECGDVALFKGETWAGNENAGLVHRSPAVPIGQARLLLTLDY
ncbi:MAG: DUF1826 domain-containing protein [Pseudomonadota bacterium]